MNFTWAIDDELSLRLLEPRHAEEVYALIDRNREHLRPWFRWAPGLESAEGAREKIVSFLHDLVDRGNTIVALASEDATAHRQPSGTATAVTRSGSNSMRSACPATP